MWAELQTMHATYQEIIQGERPYNRGFCKRLQHHLLNATFIAVLVYSAINMK